MTVETNNLEWRTFSPSYPPAGPGRPQAPLGIILSTSRGYIYGDCTIAGRPLLNASLQGSILAGWRTFLTTDPTGSAILGRVASFAALASVAPLAVVQIGVNDAKWLISTDVNQFTADMIWLGQTLFTKGYRVVLCTDYLVGSSARPEPDGFNNPLLWQFADAIRGTVLNTLIPQGPIVLCDLALPLAVDWSTPSNLLEDDIHPTPALAIDTLLPLIESAAELLP